MADTDFVPDDGITAGSRTTPQNVPPMRQAAATARELLTQLAAKQWQVDVATLQVKDGAITNPRRSRCSPMRTWPNRRTCRDLQAEHPVQCDSHACE